MPKRYLTKSLFKLAATCPRKLFYAGKAEYINRTADNSFLAALAEGGYQIGELACLMHPGGTRVHERDHDAAVGRTQELLRQDDVTIFEAALRAGPLFVRVDILRKSGRRIELIEVKAKSYRRSKDADLRSASGGISAAFLPYVQDVAFQAYVAQSALPGYEISCYLAFADAERVATVDRLNQCFRVSRNGKGIEVTIAEGTDVLVQASPLIATVCVDDHVREILSGELRVGPKSTLQFADAVGAFAAGYLEDIPQESIPSAACSGCEFVAPVPTLPSGELSGFHQCWKEAFNLTEGDFERGTVLDLWASRAKNKLIQRGVVRLDQVSKADLGLDEATDTPEGLSRRMRQWYVCRPEWPGKEDFFFDAPGFARASTKWVYPLHFIDFETSSVAIPFVKGKRPYETIAFQFSHHMLHADGSVVHRSQWLDARPGADPNEGFVRALRLALSSDDGTVFRWASHENTVLNHLREQLLAADDPPADRDELVAFIESVTSRVVEGVQRIRGHRDMVDLCKVAESFFFHPFTKGSSSLKKVLPALMRSSDFLREHYGRPAYGGPGSSLNFTAPVTWWRVENGEVQDPYRLLPAVFDDLPASLGESSEVAQDEELRDGGAALFAYARLQFEDLPAWRRAAIEAALLRYCELDTLAMVMAFQAWRDWADAQR